MKKLKEVLKSKGGWIGAIIGLGIWFTPLIGYLPPEIAESDYWYISILLGFIIGYLIEKKLRRK